MAILYLYCDYKDQVNQTDRNLLASLAKQSLLQQTSLSPEAEILYSPSQRRETPPSLRQCADLLIHSIASFDRTFIVLDALDEHLTSGQSGYSPHIPLLSELNNIQREAPGRCTMLITSREIYSIQEQLQNATRLDIRAADGDIRSYLDARIRNDQGFRFASQMRADPDLASKIVDEMVLKAQGM